MNADDSDLLRRYVKDHSEAAFEELVRRHIGLVYSAALRQVNDPHQAQDVTQLVFTDLARKATGLVRHTSLAGWLYTSTRFAAGNLRRTEQRRTIREQEAHAMQQIHHTEPEADWSKISPLLDDAMHTLAGEDREAVLLRHFEQRSYSEIGARFGLSENAARMRVDRALEKLQAALARHGITSTALALVGVLNANAIGAVPAGFVVGVARRASSVATGGIFVAISNFFASGLVKGAAALLVATLGITVFMVTRESAKPISKEVAVGNVSMETDSSTAAISDPPITPAFAGVVAAASEAATGPILRLQIVAADSGRPVPNVPMDVRMWAGETFKASKPRSDRLGICMVSYPSNVTHLEITTRLDDFADTRLQWKPENGFPIPTNYILRLERPVTIGGRVVDASGTPVAGATVGWNHEDDPTAVHPPEDHEFGWIEVATDEEGQWRINRIAEGMLRRIYGSARHKEHVDSGLMFAGQNATALRELREGRHVFRLGNGIRVQGTVEDEQGLPLSGAKVLVGGVSDSGRREGRTLEDGTFVVQGCPPGLQTVTAELDGYAVNSVKAVLGDDVDPLRLVLHNGNVLRLRVVDVEGAPIPKARIWLNIFESGPMDPDATAASAIPQVDFNRSTDEAGRVVWSNAPDAELTFGISAKKHVRSDGVKVRPDGEEHTITLNPATSVHGAVRDASSGELIPRFRVVMGWPRWNPVGNTTNAEWSNFSRDWHQFVNGTYELTFEDALIHGMKNPGYVMRFEAEGYASLVSRAIAPDEGDVQIDVTLQRADSTIVAVHTPNGLPAKNLDVGLVTPGAQLLLAPGGFSRRSGQSGGSLLTTDKRGTFQLPADESILKVIAAGAGGYAESTLASLKDNPSMQLQPWGRLEIASYSAGKPVSGREYLIELGGGSPDTVRFDFESGRVTTDEKGHATIDQMPLGNHALVRLIPQRGTGNRMSWAHETVKTPFEIRPGETTSLSIGLSNYTVVGRIQWPEGIVPHGDWSIRANLHTPIPWVLRAATNESARAAFMQTEEFKTFQKNYQGYTVSVEDLRVLTAEEVLPGNFEMEVAVLDGPIAFSLAPGQKAPAIRCIFQGTLGVQVPEMPGSGVLDIGAIELHPVTIGQSTDSR